VGLGQVGQGAARIGNGEKVAAGLLLPEPFSRPVKEIFHEGEGFHRTARLGGNDEEGSGRIERVREGENGGGIGAVQHGDIQISPGNAEDSAEDFRREAGSAHAEQKGACVVVGAHRVHGPPNPVDLGGHVARAVEPAQAVGDLRR